MVDRRFDFLWLIFSSIHGGSHIHIKRKSYMVAFNLLTFSVAIMLTTHFVTNSYFVKGFLVIS